VSEALASLRGWVSLAAALLAACLLTHTLAFGFTFATDVRTDELRPTLSSAPLEIVRASAPRAARATTRPDDGVDVNRVRSAGDVRVATAVAVSARIGSAAAVGLAVMTLLALSIAGGGNVPGVHRAAQAAFFSTALALCAVPWAAMFGPRALPGLFADDASMTAARILHDTGRAGALELFAQFIAAPLFGVFLCAMIVVWFRDGVERGVIMRSVSQFDRAVNEELRDIHRRGVATAAPRTLGALNRALGDDDPDQPSSSSPYGGRPI
jgi:hypothetical protein